MSCAKQFYVLIESAIKKSKQFKLFGGSIKPNDCSFNKSTRIVENIKVK